MHTSVIVTLFYSDGYIDVLWGYELFMEIQLGKYTIVVLLYNFCNVMYSDVYCNAAHRVK